MKIVEKVWGSEEWIVNRNYCGKILNLKKDYHCSTHKHKIKDETFYLLKGKVLFELRGKKKILLPGDIVHVPTNSYHRFTGITNSKIIEFSTRHYESDSYRKDSSGKVTKKKN